MSQSCNISISSLDDVLTGLNFSETDGHLVTSPNELVLYSPAVLVSDADSVSHYKLSGIMFGQAIDVPFCVLDHQKAPAGKVLFQVTCLDSNQNLSLVVHNFISLSCESGISNIHITGKPTETDNNSVIIQLSSSYNSQTDWKHIRVNLIIELSDCHPGYYYDTELQECVCYDKSNVVSCLNGNATILKGYWFGMINDKPTVAICPIHYCKYEDCEAVTGTCNLPSSLDEQCMPYRTGPACVYVCGVHRETVDSHSFNLMRFYN